MVEAGNVDLGLLYDVEPPPGLPARRLAREELYLVGPPGCWPGVESDASVAPEDLARVPLILPGPQHGLRIFLDQVSHRLGFRLKVASEIDSLQHIAGLVADGRGSSVLPLSAVERELAAGAMSAVRLGEGAFRRTLFLVRRPDAAVTDATRVVEELTVGLLAGMIAKRRWIAEPEADLST
jgi:LysR family nitrogen assimilation transcriptional regulator